MLLAPPISVLNDDIVGKEGWGGENVSKSDYVILECSLQTDKDIVCAERCVKKVCECKCGS